MASIGAAMVVAMEGRMSRSDKRGCGMLPASRAHQGNAIVLGPTAKRVINQNCKLEKLLDECAVPTCDDCFKARAFLLCISLPQRHAFPHRTESSSCLL